MQLHFKEIESFLIILLHPTSMSNVQLRMSIGMEQLEAPIQEKFFKISSSDLLLSTLEIGHWAFDIQLQSIESYYNVRIGIFSRISTSHYFPELLTNATDLLSGDHEGTLIVPCPPYK